MTFSINAWLDRVDPFIELRNNKTGEIMAQFSGEQLQRCLEQGDIGLTELCRADPSTQQELVRCLLLAHCSQCLQVQLEDTFNKAKGQQGYYTHNILAFTGTRSA
ncbi:MAG: hypothetical protein E6Q85_04265 [Thiothrix sp.]|nr:MAG: hypothetical protein E6Q85_04265 [Thiothrix sp.]